MTTERLNTPEAIAHRARWATIAKGFISRAEGFELKGKTRDKLAVEFFCGAATATGAEGHGGSFIAFMVATRGYSYVLEIAKLDEQDKPAEVAA